MSVEGNASGKKNLTGKITVFNVYHTDAYAIAVKNGFEGTEAEWLESLEGDTGRSPTIETERFDDGFQTGVKLTVTNPGTGNQLDQVTVTKVLDGTNGTTPNIAEVTVETLEPGAEATASISGATNHMTFALGIPQGEPGEDGGSPTISTYPFRESDGSTGVRININNPDGSIQMADVYDGKDYTPTPVFFTISGDDRVANAGLYPYEDTSRYATAEELLDAYFGGGAYVVYHKDDPRQGPNQIVGFIISIGNANALAKDPAADSWALKAFKVCTEDEFCSARAKYLT